MTDRIHHPPIIPGTKVGRLTIASIDGSRAICECTCGAVIKRTVATLKSAQSVRADSSCKQCRVKVAKGNGRGTIGRRLE